MNDLKGKIAIITGSTSGIGQSAGEQLAQHGVKVIITGRDRERGEQIAASITSSGGEALFVQADLLNQDTPKQLVHATVEKWGAIDIIVNNAALVCNKPIEDVVEEDWDRLFRVNVKAGFFLVQAALPWLKQSKGTVINVSSMNRLLNDKHNFVYDSMKAALNHLSRGLSLDLRQDGIRVNAIMPGGTATPLLKDWFLKKNYLPEEIDRVYQETISEPSVATPDQIARVIVFLASRQSEWINGAEIPLDGGYTLGG